MRSPHGDNTTKTYSKVGLWISILINCVLVACQYSPDRPALSSSPIKIETHTPMTIITTTPTPTIKLTTMPIPTSQASEIYFRKIIAVVETKNQLNLVGEDLKTIKSYPNIYIYEYFDPANCSITGFKGLSEKFEIDTIYFDKNEIQSEFALFIGDDHKLNAYDFTISPDHNWIAYKKVSGDYGMYYDTAKIQDVKLLEVDPNTPKQPIQLTTHGGALASKISWSPDGRYLSFPDYDQNGVPQIYIYAPETGEKIQVTHFGVEFAGRMIDTLKWSASSSSIFFSLIMEFYNYPHELKLAVVNIQQKTVRWIKNPIQTGLVRAAWWGKNNNIIFFFLDGQSSNFGTNEFIVWYDYTEDAIIQIIPVDYIHDIQIFPISEDLDTIMIFSDPNYFYSLSQDSVVLKDIVGTVFDEFNFRLISSASGFTWSSNCYVRP